MHEISKYFLSTENQEQCLYFPDSTSIGRRRFTELSMERLLARANKRDARMAEALAKEIREARESNDLRAPYDLARYDMAKCADLVNAAFSTPILVPQMVRFSFLVGGGKQSRQKYDPECGKFMATALRAVGYEEDRGASEDLACQGTFKQSHDTDKNILTLLVFPRVEIEAPLAGPAEESVLDWKQLPPDYLCAVCSLPVFKGLVKYRKPAGRFTDETSIRGTVPDRVRTMHASAAA